MRRRKRREKEGRERRRARAKEKAKPKSEKMKKGRRKTDRQREGGVVVENTSNNKTGQRRKGAGSRCWRAVKNGEGGIRSPAYTTKKPANRRAHPAWRSSSSSSSLASSSANRLVTVRIRHGRRRHQPNAGTTNRKLEKRTRCRSNAARAIIGC